MGMSWMSWFCWWQTLLLTVIVLSPVCDGKKPSKSSSSSQQPHIVYILADDLGWNDVSFHGSREIPTPNIDQLAHDGVILNGFYTQYECTPSRTALMTGKRPIRFGLQHSVLQEGEPRGLDTNAKLLPQYLKEAGYKNHIIGKWHLGMFQPEMTPLYRGFDSFLGYYTGSNDYYNYTPTLVPTPEYIVFDLWDDLEPGYRYIGQYSTELFTKRAVELIAHHNTDEPMFLYFSHMAPHFANAYEPIQVPQKYIDRFLHVRHEGRRKYAATVSALDDSVGAVVAALKASGMFDNSVIIFTSDNGGSGRENGEFFGLPMTFASNWPLRGAKGSQWEGGARVSACIYSPLLEKKKRISYEMYHISDWFPTFLRLAGSTAVPADLDSYDIWDSISKDLPSPRTELLHQIDPVWGEYALRWHQYKIVVGSHVEGGKRMDQWYPKDSREGGHNPRTFDADAPGALQCENEKTAAKVPCDYDNEPCLYDVIQDPCEYRNIAGENPFVVDFLLAKLSRFNQTALPSIGLPPDPRAKAAVNDGLCQPWDTHSNWA